VQASVVLDMSFNDRLKIVVGHDSEPLRLVANGFTRMGVTRVNEATREVEVCWQASEKFESWNPDPYWVGLMVNAERQSEPFAVVDQQFSQDGGPYLPQAFIPVPDAIVRDPQMILGVPSYVSGPIYSTPATRWA
jgi:hypothetical protein